jgi:hypothetical protein
MKKALTFLMLCLTALTAYSQPRTTKGTEFWFTFMENLDLSFNGPPNFTVIVSSEVPTSGAIEVPNTGLSMPFTLNASDVLEIQLPTGILYPEGDEDIITFVFRVVANDSINVYTYHNRVYFTEASVVMPVTELTSEYMITAQKDHRGQAPSEFVVEATSDNTVIEIIPSQITASFRPPFVPFNVTLDEGHVFQLQSYENLSGSTVRAIDPSKKLAVFAGARQSALRCAPADDHLYDQNYMSMYGKEFVVVPMLDQGGDVFHLVSLEDSNTVYFNFGTGVTLNKGEVIDTFFAAATYIIATRPVSVAQFNKSQTCNLSQLGDPCMVIIPPINLMKKRALFRNLDSDPNGGMAFSAFYVNIVVPSSGIGSVTMDGLPVTGFQPLTFNGQFYYKQLAIGPGTHNLYSPTGFNAFTYGLGLYNAYAYHLGYDYDATPVGLNEPDQGFNSTVYPNPFSESTTIHIQYPGELKNAVLAVYSVDGKKVMEQLFNGNTVEITRELLANGLYMYKVHEQGVAISVGRFVIN